jgi:hypothetical protein
VHLYFDEKFSLFRCRMKMRSLLLLWSLIVSFFAWFANNGNDNDIIYINSAERDVQVTLQQAPSSNVIN